MAGNRSGESPAAWIDYEVARLAEILDELLDIAKGLLPIVVRFLFGVHSKYVRATAGLLPRPLRVDEDRFPLTGNTERINDVAVSLPNRRTFPPVR